MLKIKRKFQKKFWQKTATLFSVLLILGSLFLTSLSQVVLAEGGGGNQPGNGGYILSSALNPRQVVDMEGGGEENGTKAILWQVHGQANQQFYLQKDSSDNCFSIMNLKSRKFLGVANSQAQAMVAQFTYSNSNQKWQIEACGDGYFTFELKGTGLCLDARGGQSNNGTPLWVYPRNNSPAQKFRLIRPLFSGFMAPFFGALIQYRQSLPLQNTIKIADNDDDFPFALFKECLNLENLSIPSTVKEIPPDTFVNCHGIVSLECEAKWLNLFPNPEKVRHLVILNGVKALPADFFSKFRNLETLSLPPSLGKVPQATFAQVAKLQSIRCSTKHLGYFNKQRITSVSIQPGETSIPKQVFAGFTNLTAVKLPEGIERIEERAFENCQNLARIALPRSVRRVYLSSFYGCLKLQEIQCTPELQGQLAGHITISSNPQLPLDKFDIAAFANSRSLEIPLSTTQISPKVFEHFINLYYAQCDPEWLPKLVKSRKLRGFFVPDGITGLNFTQFSRLGSLEFIQIPFSVQEIAPDTFNNCVKLQEVAAAPWWLNRFAKEKLKAVYIPNGVTTISRADFAGCTELEQLSLPDSLQSIEPGTFDDCKKLRKINCPEKFKACFSMTCNLPDGLTHLRKDYFAGWFNLQELTIPETVTEVQEGTFADCSQLKNVTCGVKQLPLVPKTITHLTLRSAPDELAPDTLLGFTDLEYLALPLNVRVIPEQTFQPCPNLKQVATSEELSARVQEIFHCQVFKGFKKVAPEYHFERDVPFRQAVSKPELPAKKTTLTDEKVQSAPKSIPVVDFHEEPKPEVPKSAIIPERFKVQMQRDLAFPFLGFRKTSGKIDYQFLLFHTRSRIAQGQNPADPAYLTYRDQVPFLQDYAHFLQEKTNEQRFPEWLQKHLAKVNSNTKQPLFRLPDGQINFPELFRAVNWRIMDKKREQPSFVESVEDWEQYLSFLQAKERQERQKARNQVQKPGQSRANAPAPSPGSQRPSGSFVKPPAPSPAGSENSGPNVDLVGPPAPESARSTCQPIDEQERPPKETTVDDLVAFDPTNAKYAHYIKRVLRLIEQRKDAPVVGNSISSLRNLSFMVDEICQKIYRSNRIARENGFHIIPRPVKFWRFCA